MISAPPTPTRSAARRPGPDRRRTSEAEFVSRLLPAAQQAAAGHASLSAAYAATDATAVRDPAEERDAKFGYGLDVVLDGLAARLPH